MEHFISHINMDAIPEKYIADFNHLLVDKWFTRCKEGSEAIAKAVEILRSQYERIPFSVIGSFFKISKGTVRNHWARRKHLDDKKNKIYLIKRAKRHNI